MADEPPFDSRPMRVTRCACGAWHTCPFGHPIEADEAEPPTPDDDN